MADPPPLRGSRLWAMRLLALGLAATAVVGALELTLRLVPQRPAFDRDTRVPTTKRASPPGQPDFRGGEWPAAKPPGAFRTLIVGDSFTWGQGVYPQDTYGGRIDRALARSLVTERPFDTVIWSRPGWNTETELRLLEPHLPELDPDLLILGFVLNDAEPSEMWRREAAQAPMLHRPPAAGLRAFLVGHSRLAGLVYRRLETTRQRRAIHRYYRDLFAPGPDWRACVRALEGFADQARARRIELLVVIFPVFDSQLDERYAYHAAHRRVRGVCRRLGIPALDLLRAYQGIDGRRLAVLPFTDSHPSELAHRIAAETIVQYLLRKKMIPARMP